MIVLNKKKIRLTILIVFVLVFGVAILKDNKESVPTVSLPVSGKTIVIDAGHGKPDEGAQSSRGTTEAETNLKIALKLQNLLEQSGSTVVLTRSDENAIYDLDAKTRTTHKKWVQVGTLRKSLNEFYMPDGNIYELKIEWDENHIPTISETIMLNEDEYVSTATKDCYRR